MNPLAEIYREKRRNMMLYDMEHINVHFAARDIVWKTVRDPLIFLFVGYINNTQNSIKEAIQRNTI